MASNDIQMWDMQVEDCYFVSNADDFKGVGEKTPVNGMIKHACLLENVENKNMGEPWSQSKRRRVLEFDSAGDLVKDVLSEMSNWLCEDNADGTSLPSQEVMDQSFEGWLSSCLTEDMDASAPSDIENQAIGSRNIRHIKESTILLPGRPNVRVRHNSNFKGKKLNMRTSDTSSSASVVSPFTLLKQRNFTGDEVTLKDINRRMHSPPTIQEVLIEYSAFSGKPIVAKTKIWTQGGKGSITIMRTKG